MKPTSLRFSLLIAVAVCAVPLENAQATLLAYEPFDYGTTTEPDRNGDGKKDILELTGGSGWGGAWLENTGTVTDLTGYPLDSVNGFNLIHPSGDLRFSTAGAGSLDSRTFTTKIQNFPRNTLTRDFADPVLLTEGTSIWVSVLLRKDFEVPNTDGSTRVGDLLEVGLTTAEGLEGSYVAMGDIRGLGIQGSTEFGIVGSNATPSTAYLTGSGPAIGITNFLVMKLSIAPGDSLLEFFLNPSLDELSPESDVNLEINDGILNQEITTLMVNLNPSASTWTLDEIRVGTTYADVIPEPSSLLLTSIGVAMLGLTRRRNSRQR